MTKFNQKQTSASGSSIHLNMYNVSFCDIFRHHFELLGCENKNTTELFMDYPSWKFKRLTINQTGQFLDGTCHNMYIYIYRTLRQ